MDVRKCLSVIGRRQEIILGYTVRGNCQAAEKYNWPLAQRKMPVDWPMTPIVQGTTLCPDVVMISVVRLFFWTSTPTKWMNRYRRGIWGKETTGKYCQQTMRRLFSVFPHSLLLFLDIPSSHPSLGPALPISEVLVVVFGDDKPSRGIKGAWSVGDHDGFAYGEFPRWVSDRFVKWSVSVVLVVTPFLSILFASSFHYSFILPSNSMVLGTK